MSLLELARNVQADTPVYCRAVDVEVFRSVLRAYRKKTVDTQEALSARTGDAAAAIAPIDTQTISNIERGVTADPGIVTIARLVEAMGVTLSEFFLQIERQTDADSGDPANSTITTPPHKGGGGDGGASPFVSAAAERSILIRLSRILAEAAAQTPATSGEAAKTRPRKPTGHRGD